MDINFNIMMIAVCICVGIVTAIMLAASALHAWFNMKREELKFQMEVAKNKPPDRIKNLQYSKDCMDFVRTVVAQEAVLFFRNFVDSHHIEKVTLAQVKNIVADVANQVNKSMKRDCIDFECTLFNEEFYNHYIVECSKDYVKRLLSQYLIEVVDE